MGRCTVYSEKINLTKDYTSIYVIDLTDLLYSKTVIRYECARMYPANIPGCKILSAEVFAGF